MLQDATQRWNANDANELYEVTRWGKGYFSVAKHGNVLVHPSGDPAQALDLKSLVDQLQERGISLPILVRFGGILRHRMQQIHDAFARAAGEYGYENRYTCVYPIKVNQQAHVVEEIVRYGDAFGFGLEAGSKPEMLAVIAMGHAERPIICNGFKDAEFVEMALLAQKMGRQVIPVVEKFSELELVLRIAEKVDVRPMIGARVKLAARGAGRWQGSGGFQSKFGLTVSELLQANDLLAKRGLSDCFQLLHFHLGSQVTNIRQIKNALIEAARIYVDLVGQGAGLQYLDVGGGLGVDYDGSQSNCESSINYTLQEYANDVVYHVQSVCNDAGVPHPHLISESGRAIAAYHSVLVFGALGTSGPPEEELTEPLADDAPQPLGELQETLAELSTRNVLESFHDAQQWLEMAMGLFNAGHLTLRQRAIAERLFWSICQRANELTAELDYVPAELAQLDRMLSGTYFCNFSLFQSMPDSWAIKQLFPVLPIHRLDERPTRHAVVGDITCDSDGKIDRFIGARDTQRTLLLHEPDGEPYLLGAFLVGAYQEILGDLHNLLGDTNAVHISLTDTGEVTLEHAVAGDTVAEVLGYVEFTRETLVKRLQSAVELAVQANRISHREAGRVLRFYEQALAGYTYLEVEED
ncbi:MAG: arginine decarboxylase [Blastopirellula sp.]|nr:arginine decarboxylase [Blastopirellula sp.]